MRLTRSAALLFLLAALFVPPLALFPGLMHVFDPPKSATWELFAVLAGSLALACASGPGRRGDGIWWVLWSLWALIALWFAAVSQAHSLFVGGNLNEFPLWFRFKQWLFEHWAFGLDLTSDLAGDRLFRATEGLAALTFMAQAWRSRAVQDPVLGRPARLAFGLAGLWCLSESLSLRPDLASPALLDWGGYLLVFGAVWLLAWDPKTRDKVLAAVLLAAALNAFYGLAQSAGYDFLPWAETFGGRASGFFGNPDFLGGHLALALPLALALALRPSRRPVGAAALWALVWLLGAALVATQTRGAWIAAGLGCALALAGVHRAAPGRLRACRRVLAATALALSLGLAAFWSLSSSASHARFTGALSRDPEAGRRVWLMEKTAQVADGHPLLGVGPGNFRVWLPSVEVQGLNPSDYLTHPYTVSEHGHNDFLQMAADAGWPAALLWACLCVSVWLLLFRGLAKVPSESGILVAGCLGALTALRVHGLANFPFQVVPTEATGWALAALGLGALREAPLSVGDSASPSAALRPARRWLLAGLLAACAVVMVRGRQAFEEGLWWVGAGELGLKRPQTAAPLLLKALGIDPREDRLWDLHGQAHFDRGDVWQSIGSLRESHRLNPYDAETSVRLGLALIENRLYDEAYAVLSQAAIRAPNYPDVWEPLVAASFQDKRYSDAVQACDWMLYYHIHEESAYTNKAAAWGSMGQLQQAWMTLDEAQRRFPGSGKVQVNLAITLYKMGLRKEAYAAWKRAAVLVPSDPQVDNLRKVLRP